MVSLLCLHGLGCSAAIFKFQTAILRSKLAPSDDLVFVDAPPETSPGPGVLPLFANAGPFYSWFANQQQPDPLEALCNALKDAFADKDLSKPWGVMGFSQGAIAAALLILQQQRKRLPWLPVFHYGVLVCSDLDDNLVELARRSSSFESEVDELAELIINKPTLHVVGTQDPYASQSRELADSHTKSHQRTVFEFSGGHHVPQNISECEQVAAAIRDIASAAAKARCET